MSGLSHTPGKRAWGKTHRGFESRLLRQLVLKIPCKSIIYKGFFSSVRILNAIFYDGKLLNFRQNCARFAPEVCPFCAGVSCAAVFEISRTFFCVQAGKF